MYAVPPHRQEEVNRQLVSGLFSFPWRLRFNDLNSHLVRYREESYDEVIWTRRFLFKPKKFRDGWHWLAWSYVRHIADGLGWTYEWVSADEFLLYKLANNLVKVEH